MYRVLLLGVVRVVVGPHHGPVLISGPALAGHGAVERGVELGRAVRSGIPGSYSLHKRVN